MIAARQPQPSPVPERVPIEARYASESCAEASSVQRPLCWSSPMLKPVLVNARRFGSPRPNITLQPTPPTLIVKYFTFHQPWRSRPPVRRRG